MGRQVQWYLPLSSNNYGMMQVLEAAELHYWWSAGGPPCFLGLFRLPQCCRVFQMAGDGGPSTSVHHSHGSHG